MIFNDERGNGKNAGVKGKKYKMALVSVMNASWMVCYRKVMSVRIRRKAVSTHLNVLVINSELHFLML